MTKREIFKQAHELARTFEGNYRVCFIMALKEIFSNLKGENMKVKIAITCDNDITKNLFEEVIEVSSIEEAKEITQIEFNKIAGEFSENKEMRTSTGYWIYYFDLKDKKSFEINNLNFENGSNSLVAMNHPRFMVNIFNVA